MTTAQIVDKIITGSPFLEEALSEGLINISSLSRKLKPEIEKVLQKKVQLGTILMAIKRRPAGHSFKVTREIKNFMDKLGDIIVRSGLSDYTFENSTGLNSCNRQLIDETAGEKEMFCTVSQGVYETTLVVSNVMAERINTIYLNEKLLAQKTGLSSITIRLPESNTEISGIYYFLLKNLAWSGINVCEIISTSNEVTFVLDEQDVHKAFSILMGIKQA